MNTGTFILIFNITWIRVLQSNNENRRMNRTSCSVGLFSDRLFDDSSPPCSQRTAVWIGPMIAFLLLYTVAVVASFKTWQIIHARTSHSIKKRYCGKRRLPLVPTLLLTSAISSFCFWILASLDVANYSNGLSLILLGIHLIIQLFVSSIELLRFVRIGLKMMPLARKVAELNPSATQRASLPEQRPITGITGIAAESPQEVPPPGQQHSLVVSPVVEESDSAIHEIPLAAASGTYATLQKAINETRHSSKGEMSVTDSTQNVRYRELDTSEFDLTLKLCLATAILCSLAGSITSIVGGALATDRSLFLTVTCYLFGVSHIFDTLVIAWQLRRNKAALLTLIRGDESALKGNTQFTRSLRFMRRQRDVGMVMHMTYSAIALYCAGQTQVRPWYLFFIIDWFVLVHNVATLYFVYSKQVDRIMKLRKKTMELNQRGTVVRQIRSEMGAVYSSNNYNLKHHEEKESSLGAESATSASGIVIPTYEEAWEQGFRWRRWSAEFKKERRAFVGDYKNWLRQQKQSHAGVNAEEAVKTNADETHQTVPIQ